MFSSAVPTEGLEEEGGAVLSAGLVALITILSIVVVLTVLVVLSRALGFLTPPFERLDNVPLVGALASKKHLPSGRL